MGPVALAPWSNTGAKTQTAANDSDGGGMKYYVYQADAPGIWVLFEPGDQPYVSITTQEPDRSDPKTVVFEIAIGTKVGFMGPHQLVFTET